MGKTWDEGGSHMSLVVFWRCGCFLSLGFFFKPPKVCIIMKSIPNKVKGIHIVDFPPETR